MKITKTKEEQLAAFKRANKLRRNKMATKAGFSNKEAYLAYLNGKPSKSAKVKKEEPKVKLDYVVAFDTTGSMERYIKNVKEHVEKLIPELFSQDTDLMMKIVAFGDYCDIPAYNNPKNGFGNAYQESEFTKDQTKLIKFVNNAENTGGGDSDEFYELVIKKITEETPWREGSKRTVLLIADCNPHNVGYRYGNKTYDIDWKVEAKKAAAKNISFDTLSILGYHFYAELSEMTNGVNLPFKSSNNMANVMAATSYVRGGAKAKVTFDTMETAAYASGDSELIGTYKVLSKLK